jgi:Phosphotransferase enzyme family
VSLLDQLLAGRAPGRADARAGRLGCLVVDRHGRVRGLGGLVGGRRGAALQTTRRLHAFLEPARGQRLPAADVVHGDLNLSNVLARDGVITGIVDWDHAGVGSRALDLTSLLFDWQRLQFAHESALAPDGGERLVCRIVRVAASRACAARAPTARSRGSR